MQDPVSDDSSSGHSFIVATAGHVDHGKSSLVRQLTGQETDTLKEEKARGLTINLGYAYRNLNTEQPGRPPALTIGFVDVPGHSDFINNMLAGVGSVDAAMLVVAADDGVMPQTREHLAILSLLGIQSLFVVISKADLVAPAQLTAASNQVSELVTDLGWLDFPVFQVSNSTGQGIENLSTYLDNLALSFQRGSGNSYDRNTRFLIDRSFSPKGKGTVVTGSVRTGAISEGDELFHSKSGTRTRIRSIQLASHQLAQVNAGDRAALNISLARESVMRGDWLIGTKDFCLTQRFDAIFRALEKGQELKGSAEYHLHTGASHRIVKARYLETGPDADNFMQVLCDEPLYLCHGDRFILRDPSSQNTLGGGQVLDIFVPRRGRASESRLNQLRAQKLATLPCMLHLIETQLEGVNLEHFASNHNLSNVGLRLLLGDAAKSCAFVSLETGPGNNPVALGQQFYEEYESQLISALGAYHISNSSKQGASILELIQSASLSCPQKLLYAIVERMISDQTLCKSGTLLHLPGHVAQLSQEEIEFNEKVLPLLSQAGTVPPRTRELVELTGIPLRPLLRILQAATRGGSLIRVAENRYFLPERILQLAELTEQLAAQSQDGEGFSVIRFRDETGIGRNLCIEILEYFDSVGFTRRDGNSRFLRTDKENIFGTYL